MKTTNDDAAVETGVGLRREGKVVVGGLIAGTLLTLFYVPVLYTWLDDVRTEARRWMSWIAGRRTEGTAK